METTKIRRREQLQTLSQGRKNQAYKNEQNTLNDERKTLFQIDLDISDRQLKAQLIEKNKILLTPQLNLKQSPLLLKRKQQKKTESCKFQLAEQIEKLIEKVQDKNNFKRTEKSKERKNYQQRQRTQEKEYSREESKQEQPQEVREQKEEKMNKCFRLNKEFSQDLLFGGMIVIFIIIYKGLFYYLLR